MKNKPSLAAQKTSFDTRELIAVWLSAAIAVGAAIYWIVQINGVLEMLKLAYG